MQHAFTLFGSAFATFFAIMNPIANTPVFLSLTEELDEKQTRSVAFRSISLALLIVAAFSLAGGFLLHLFGITLSAFRIAGGLLVALVGYHLLQGGMNYAAGGSPQRLGIVLAAFFLICLLTYCCFMCGRRLTRFLGKSLVRVISRLMGLILSVIGTQMVIEGITGVVKGGPS